MRKIFIFFLILIFGLYADDFIECYYIPDPPPSIDGNLGEWYKIKGIEIKGENVVYGKEKWKDENDLSGIIWVGWRNESLFVGVEVIDDKLVQNMTGKDLWKGDHVEVYIDTKWTPDVKGSFGEGQFHIGFSPGNLQNTGDILFDIPPEYYIFKPLNMEIKNEIKVCALKTENGYNIEFSIPFNVLKIQPKEGMVIGIDICISDTDNPDIQEKMTSLITQKPWQCAERSRLKALKFVGAPK